MLNLLLADDLHGLMQIGRMRKPPGRLMDARATAALGLFRRADLTVEVLDELHWRIMPSTALNQLLEADRSYLFWPATGYWKRPDGSQGGGGARRLIEDMRRAAASPGQP